MVVPRRRLITTWQRHRKSQDKTSSTTLEILFWYTSFVHNGSNWDSPTIHKASLTTKDFQRTRQGKNGGDILSPWCCLSHTSGRVQINDESWPYSLTYRYENSTQGNFYALETIFMHQLPKFPYQMILP